VIARLSEARQLTGFAGETYRPMIDDVIAWLEGLRATVDGLGNQQSFRAHLAAMGGPSRTSATLWTTPPSSFRHPA